MVVSLIVHPVVVVVIVVEVDWATLLVVTVVADLKDLLLSRLLNQIQGVEPSSKINSR